MAVVSSRAELPARMPFVDRRDLPDEDFVPVSSDSGEALKAELDDLLDEIDDVLETNAEDFVKSYIQRGGNGDDEVRFYIEHLVERSSLREMQLLESIVTSFLLDHDRERLRQELMSLETSSDITLEIYHAIEREPRFAHELADSLAIMFEGEWHGDFHAGPDSRWQEIAHSVGRSQLDRAAQLLDELILEDKARYRYEEFEFLDDSRHTINDSTRRIAAFAWQIVSATTTTPIGQLRRSSATHKSILDVRNGVIDEIVGPTSRPSGRRRGRVVLNEALGDLGARDRGEHLESSLEALLSRVFSLDPSDRQTLLRRQTAGAQFGSDIVLNATLRSNEQLRVHLECKFRSKTTIGLEQVAAKLAQTKFYYSDNPVDVWVLVTPFAEPTSELHLMIDQWNETGEYPFDIHVWSKSTGLRDFFRLDKELFDLYYPGDTWEPPTELPHVVTSLRPPVRVPEPFRRYSNEPERLCFPWEDRRHFGELLSTAVTQRAADEAGSDIGQSLPDYLWAWATRAGSRESLLLLAPFGEGKSYATFELTNQLLERFRADPTNSCYPLRMALKQFRGEPSASEYLKSQLARIGSSVGDFETLRATHSVLIVLDGLDEMSVGLAAEDITDNLRKIRDLFDLLSDCAILITSRDSYFESRLDERRFLERLRNPTVARIKPATRARRLKYLRDAARNTSERNKVDRIRDLYDPIGLAAKVLFLEMIRSTMADLPEHDFDEVVLYETYINSSLRRKIEYLDDTALLTTQQELVANMRAVLEQIAVHLQATGEPAVDLRREDLFDQGVVPLLWRISGDIPGAGEGSEEDAIQRVAIRSLLQPVMPESEADGWRVEFFHRSMQEYFVARALLSAIDSDPELIELLERIELQPVIVSFFARAAQRELNQTMLEQLSHRLLGLARSARVGSGRSRLGGNCLTLLHCLSFPIEGDDWSDLVLDRAQLPGADLSGKCFAGSSLKSANLDNAKLRYADVTNADLEGVRLDLTATPEALAGVGDGLLVSYDDGSYRVWRQGEDMAWNDVLAMTEHTLAGQDITQLSETTGLTMGRLGCGLYQLRGDGKVEWISRFRQQGRVRQVLGRSAHLGGLRLLVESSALEGEVVEVALEKDGPSIASLVSLVDLSFPCAMVGDLLVSSAMLGDPAATMVLDGGTVGPHTSLDLFERNVTAIGGCELVPGEDWAVLFGLDNGSLLARRVTLVERDSLTSHPLEVIGSHDASVTSIAGVSNGLIATGSLDRQVAVWAATTEAVSVTRQLSRELDCKGMTFEGVKGPREAARLATLASRPD